MAAQIFKGSIVQTMEKAKSMKDEEKLYKRNGILYSTVLSPPETFEALKDLEARTDDIFVIAYPKCGFNWMVGMMRKMMDACGVTIPPKAPLIEFHSPDSQKELTALTSRRFIGTHLHPDNIPVSFKAKKTKMLVIFRNPKDTVVSFYHFMNKNPVLPKAESWDKFFSDFMTGEVAWGSYFDHALAWEKHMDDPDVMLLTYEEMKEDLVGSLQRITKFFSIPLTNEKIEEIAGQSTFSAMLESSKNTHGNLSNVFFRKGEIGDWRNHFSDEQSKEMDEMFQKKLAGTKLGARLKYNLYCQ